MTQQSGASSAVLEVLGASEVGPADGGRVKGLVLAIVLMLGGSGVLLTVNQTFNLQLFGSLSSTRPSITSCWRSSCR